MSTTQLRSRPDSPGSMLRRTVRRLSDPSDTAAAALAALAVLTVEAALCPLIVWAVPCELLPSCRDPLRRACCHCKDVTASGVMTAQQDSMWTCTLTATDAHVCRHGDRLASLHGADSNLPEGMLIPMR